MRTASFRALGYSVILGSALIANAAPKQGDVTFYDPMQVGSKTGIGACGGDPLDASMPIAALAKAYFDSYPGAGANSNGNPVCGKQVRVTIRGKSVDVTIRDRCESCEKPFDIDLSNSSFSQIADLAAGRVPGSWDFINPADDIGMKPDDTSGPPDQSAPSSEAPPSPTNPGQPPAPAPTDQNDPAAPGNSGTPPGQDQAFGNGAPPPIPSSSFGPDGKTPGDKFNPGAQKRRLAAQGRGTSRTGPRRMSRVVRGLIKDTENSRREFELGQATKKKRLEMRPRRLSRVMRGVVLGGQD